ncbi:YDG/SRA domain-containing protein [Pedobacter foliorum]|uniref:YDG/SRA domain-containing protein n=1 Tax=Pedobacter foliorum TaxID=2739058 RepID=UPI001563DF54|nr:YDG/SRA domain-containing protein [Pedobacter foliorum]NRF37195.1 HNH endonuclease [Pedobacter foliorum]
MAAIQFGEIEGIKEGDTFISRQEMTNKGLHRNTVQGIDGNGEHGSASIVLNGGYEDDKDYGNLIIYTGHGGNVNKKQIRDQSWDDPGNKGLLISEMHGLPVRVSRGPKHKSKFSPEKGYQYGGLYMVTSHKYKKGAHGFWVCLFRLEKISSIVSNSFDIRELSVDYKTGETSRVASTILRIVRDTRLSRKVKELYNYTCQICALRIEFNGVGYAEAAHIRPLGKPHNGKDLLNNLLCLCPNHHVMFDKGHFTINNDFSCEGISEGITVLDGHILDPDNLNYHKEHHK